MSEAATGLTLTGAEAEVRSVATYLAETKPDGQPRDGKVVVRFSVSGCTELDVCVKGGTCTTCTTWSLGPLKAQGSDVAVALSIRDGNLTQQVWRDGQDENGPITNSWNDFKQPTPAATERVQGVEVVSMYAPGRMSRWRGVYVMCVLRSRGAAIRMSDAAAASVATAPASRKARLLVEVEELLRQLHAEAPRPSFDEACAEDPKTGEPIGIDNGESDDLIDEALDKLPDWDEGWPCDEEYAREGEEDSSGE